MTVLRTRRVRRTVDLSPNAHAGLTRWCANTADDLGLARVTGQDVLEALVTRLLEDQRVSAEIRADISRSVRQ
jgi:hypothetical protein